MSNIVVVSDTGVEVYKKWSDVKKDLNMEKEEFAEVGIDYICNLTGDSYEVAKDIALLERVASERVFAKSKMNNTDYMIAGTLLLVIISMLS